VSGIYFRVKTVSGESFSQEQNNVGSNREILLQIDTKNNTYWSNKYYTKNNTYWSNKYYSLCAIFLICDGLYGGMEFHVVCHGLYIGDFK
jgi:hypothetical protein